MRVFIEYHRQFVVIVAIGCTVGAMLMGCSFGFERGKSARPGASERSNDPPRSAFSYGPTGPQASPRVIGRGYSIPKGGGRDKLGAPYSVGGRTFVPRHDPSYDRIGIASWYGDKFHGRKTANGEIYDAEALTAAHPTLPIPSYAYVTNLGNNRTLLVRLNDRGPFMKGRIIDLSRRVARLLALKRSGTGRVRVQYAGPAPLSGHDRYERQFLSQQAWYRARSY